MNSNTAIADRLKTTTATGTDALKGKLHDINDTVIHKIRPQRHPRLNRIGGFAMVTVALVMLREGKKRMAGS